MRCAHFVSLAPAAALPLAPALVEVLDWPLLLPLVEDEGVVCELVLPEALELEGVVVCERVLPLAAPRSRRQRSFSAGIMLSQLLLAMPPAAALPDAPPVCAAVLPDDVWAIEALDSARSAAAVALAKTFRFIWMLLLRMVARNAAPNTQTACRFTPARLYRRSQHRRSRSTDTRSDWRQRGQRQGADSAVAQIDFSAKRYFDVPELELPLGLGEVLAPLLAGLELDGLVVCELVLPLPEVLELDGVWELVLPLAPPEVPCEAK
jgi:hypothetical protein